MKWAIREAVDVYFKAKSNFKLGARMIRTGEPVLIFDTVKTSTLEVQSESSYVTGGRGNTRLLAYEGDKTMTFQFEDALLSNEGLAILAGADLIPARNKNLYGAHSDARSVISHVTEKYSVITGNYIDDDRNNTYADDTSLYPQAGRELAPITTAVTQAGDNYTISLKIDGEADPVQGTLTVGSTAVAVNNYEGIYLNEAFAATQTVVQVINKYDTTTTEGRAAGVSEYDSEDGNGTIIKKIYKDYSPRGGKLNVWLENKPYVGQNASIYVMLLDTNGEMSGTPIEVNLNSPENDSRRSYLAKWGSGDYFVAFNNQGKPIGNPDVLLEDDGGSPKVDGTYNTTEFGGALKDLPKHNYGAVTGSAKRYSGRHYGYFSDEEAWADPKNNATADMKKNVAAFDDGVAHYVDLASAAANWISGWGPIEYYIRKITASNYGKGFANTGCGATETVTAVTDRNGYAYLLAPSGGVAQPKGFREGGKCVYKVNVPSILYQDIVLVDYYVEYRHNATQVSILPDKFGPYMYVEGSSLVRRASDGMDLPVEFVIPKFKITTSLSFTLQSSGDASTFTFQGDAYSDYSKFDMTRKVLADIQILEADDNYDGVDSGSADPTGYRRYRYNEDTEGEYLWKDPSIEAHGNLDYSDTGYYPAQGGPATRTTNGKTGGLIDTAKDAPANKYTDPDAAAQEVGGQGGFRVG